jgi:hypothetical protein
VRLPGKSIRLHVAVHGTAVNEEQVRPSINDLDDWDLCDVAVTVYEAPDSRTGGLIIPIAQRVLYGDVIGKKTRMRDWV